MISRATTITTTRRSKVNSEFILLLLVHRSLHASRQQQQRQPNSIPTRSIGHRVKGQSHHVDRMSVQFSSFMSLQQQPDKNSIRKLSIGQRSITPRGPDARAILLTHRSNLATINSNLKLSIGHQVKGHNHTTWAGRQYNFPHSTKSCHNIKNSILKLSIGHRVRGQSHHVHGMPVQRTRIAN